MRKTMKRLIIALLILLFFASAGFSQFRSNAPFKPHTPSAPDFTLKDLDGKTFRMSAQKGKPVLIFFGTTWCPACRTEIPKYRKIQETYAPKGLEVVYINIMEPAAKVSRFARANAINYRVLLDEDGAVGTRYNVIGVPMMVLVGRDGVIVKVSHSSSDMPLDALF
ncbi:MAG: TlpA disulfide reductase family protein [Smithellaceae bacterium]